MPGATVGTDMTAPIRPTHRSRSTAPALLGAILVATVVAGCAFMSGTSASPGPSASVPPPGPLVSVETRGGHCVAGTCGSIVILDTDGTVRTAAKPPAEIGTVPDEDVAGLAALIASTDFAEIKSRPFTGTCPVAFDGQEVVFEFMVTDGVERIESCATKVDPRHPLFEAVAGILGPFISLPLE
jgi:hypothetical protein